MEIGPDLRNGQREAPAVQAADADARGGYNQLYGGDRNRRLPACALLEPCERKFFELADIEGNIRTGKDVAEISPIAFEDVTRIAGKLVLTAASQKALVILNAMLRTAMNVRLTVQA